jgi:hypothetical protein
MKLAKWFDTVKLSPDKGLCMSIGTDGVSFTKNVLMSISYKSTSEGDTLYINGAKPTLVEQYTGVDQAYYDGKCMGEARVLELFLPVLNKYDFLVVYNERFFRDWLTPKFPVILEKPILDLTAFYKIKDKGEEIPEGIKTVQELGQRLQSATVGLKKGYSFQDYVNKYLPGNKDICTGRALEEKTMQLFMLYRMALYM